VLFTAPRSCVVLSLSFALTLSCVLSDAAPVSDAVAAPVKTVLAWC
jgi:hypothetical protein